MFQIELIKQCREHAQSMKTCSCTIKPLDFLVKNCQENDSIISASILIITLLKRTNFREFWSISQN